MYSFCAMYSLRMSFCSVPEMRRQSTPCFSATARYMAHRYGGRRIDGHRDGDVAQRDAAKQSLHVFERRDGDAALADFAVRHRVIGIVAHQGGQVEGHRESGLALAQK